MSIYISAIYLVILTFTSIGYGDVRPEAESSTSMLYALLVLMMGMIINGYMIGTFQQIMKEIESIDLKTEFEDKLDMFIIKLG